MIHQYAGIFIKNNSAILSNRIAERVYSQYQNMFSHYSMEIDALRSLFNNDFSKLFLAIVSERPSIFTDYIEWKRCMLECRLIPVFVLKKNYEIFMEEILNTSDDEIKEILKEYLQIGLETYDKLLARTDSFIDRSSSNAKFSKELLEILLECNEGKALNFLNENLHINFTLDELYNDIIKNTQYEIGLLWQTNKITPFQEHCATNIVCMIIDAIRPPASYSPDTIRVITSCPPLEEHSVGLRIVSSYLTQKGILCRFSGANTPIQSILTGIKSFNPHVLALSIAIPIRIHHLGSLIENVKEIKPGLKIIVGGYLFDNDPDLWKYINVDGYSKNPEQAYKLINDLVNTDTKL